MREYLKKALSWIKPIIFTAVIVTVAVIYFTISTQPEGGKGMVIINQTYDVYKVYKGFVGGIGPIYIVDYYDDGEIKSIAIGDRDSRIIPTKESKAILVLNSIYREYKDDKYNRKYFTLYLPDNYTITGISSTYRVGKHEETSTVYNPES